MDHDKVPPRVRDRSQKERPCQDCRTRSRAPCSRAPAGAVLPALGRRHSCLRLRRRPAPVTSTGPARRRTCSGKGSVSGCWPRRRRRSPGRPRLPPVGRAQRCPAGALKGGSQSMRCFAVHPDRVRGSGAKPFQLSHLGSRVKSASPKHDACELAAVKDRGCPPILRALRRAPCAPQNRLPPRPLGAAAWPAAPPSCDCLTPASFKAHLSSR